MSFSLFADHVVTRGAVRGDRSESRFGSNGYTFEIFQMGSFQQRIAGGWAYTCYRFKVNNDIPELPAVQLCRIPAALRIVFLTSKTNSLQLLAENLFQ